MKKVLLIILLFTACSQEQPEKVKPEVKSVNNYCVRIFSPDSIDAKALTAKLDLFLNDSVAFVRQGNKFITEIGFYKTAMEAANKGFELYADSLIDSYSIYENDSLLENPYKDFYYVGKYIDHPSLYKINLFSLKSELVWKKWGRKVISLDRAADGQSLYMTTVLSKGMKAGFPSITNLRLYFMNTSSEKVKFLYKFGNGLGVNSTWESDTSFAFYFTSLDSFATSTVFQRKYLYDNQGKLVDESETQFDLVKDGIEFPNLDDINPVSPSLSYQYKLLAEDSASVVTLENNIDGSEVEICSTYSTVVKSEWTPDESFLFLTIRDLAASDSTDLIVVQAKEGKMISKFRGEGEKNFIVRGNLLIFDDGFGKDSDIVFYRYRKNEIYYRLQPEGGCGVKHIPSREKLF